MLQVNLIRSVLDRQFPFSEPLAVMASAVGRPGSVRREYFTVAGLREHAHPGRRARSREAAMTSNTTRRALLAGTAASLAGLRTTLVRADDARVARVQSDDEVLSWDPHAAWHRQSVTAFRHVYEALVHIGPSLAPEPCARDLLAAGRAHRVGARAAPGRALPGRHAADGRGCRLQPRARQGRGLRIQPLRHRDRPGRGRGRRPGPDRHRAARPPPGQQARLAPDHVEGLGRGARRDRGRLVASARGELRPRPCHGHGAVPAGGGRAQAIRSRAQPGLVGPRALAVRCRSGRVHHELRQRCRARRPARGPH